MTPEHLIEKLRNLKLFTSVHHVTTFECYRETTSGEAQRVIVEIHDAGPNATAGLRYSCVATTDGKAATGNSHASLDVVLATVHWGDLG